MKNTTTQQITFGTMTRVEQELGGMEKDEYGQKRI